MNLKFHPVIPFDHNNVLRKLIVCGDNEMLRITVKPVFIGMEWEEISWLLEKWSSNGNHNSSADGMPMAKIHKLSLKHYSLGFHLLISF